MNTFILTVIGSLIGIVMIVIAVVTTNTITMFRLASKRERAIGKELKIDKFLIMSNTATRNEKFVITNDNCYTIIFKHNTDCITNVEDEEYGLLKDALIAIYHMIYKTIDAKCVDKFYKYLTTYHTFYDTLSKIGVKSANDLLLIIEKSET